ncbi:hypothetical protein AB0D45_21100 [Streptomyces sp. NPDC048352]|uniref:hypothetical protein n=1 Tax=Streptomyces sp. NPDC048352 TaxID=3154718 RepID=UPI0034292978
MPVLTYENVMNAPVDKLATAIRDWKAMVTKLEELAEAARGGMKAKSDKAEWSGVTAGVARPFVDKTAKEFEEAAKAAKGIHRALAQGHDTFRSSRDRLRKITEEEAPAAGFRVDAKGKVEPLPLATEADRHAARHDPDYQESLRVNRPLWQAKIDAAVDACDDVDQSLARLLNANVAEDHNFSAPKYAGLTAEQAGRATALARKGRDLSHTELAELNELLADNAKKPEFSTTFYGNLGPKGALQFFGSMATDTGARGFDEQRLKDIQDLQKNLGLNLATATDPDNPQHLPDRFAQDLRRLGTERIPLSAHDGNPPFGYQLLGGIMRYGNYDRRFLVPIADHAVQVQEKDKNFFFQNKPINGWTQTQFNPSGGSGAGFDPVNSFLEALGHSPEAATEFFKRDGSDLVAYNQDGTVKAGAPNLGKDVTNYLDYFAREKYASPTDSNDLDAKGVAAAKQYMPDALGHALEAATLGHAWDDAAPGLKRSEDTAEVMEAVVAKYGGDAGLLKHHEALADSLGRMTAGYIDDVNWALSGDGKDGVFAPPEHARDGHMELDRESARDLISALGQHADPYATLTTAERVYGATVLESQGFHDGQVDEGRALATLSVTAEFQGVLDDSRARQLGAEAEKQNEAFEKAVEQRSAWIEFGTSAAIGGAVALLPATIAGAGVAAVAVPIAIDTGSGAVEQAASSAITEWSDKAVEKKKDEVDDATHAATKAMYQSGERSAETPLKQFQERHGISDTSVLGNGLKKTVRDGYTSGMSRSAQQGHAAQTEAP